MLHLGKSARWAAQVLSRPSGTPLPLTIQAIYTPGGLENALNVS